jgi:hypothetical protein
MPPQGRAGVSLSASDFKPRRCRTRDALRRDAGRAAALRESEATLRRVVRPRPTPFLDVPTLTACKPRGAARPPN